MHAREDTTVIRFSQNSLLLAPRKKNYNKLTVDKIFVPLELIFSPYNENTYRPIRKGLRIERANVEDMTIAED